MWEKVVIICLKFPSNFWELFGITRRNHKIVSTQTAFESGTSEIQVHSFLTFCGFVLHGFAPRTLIHHSDPSVDKEHQNCSVI
jgi:hypothetical protein